MRQVKITKNIVQKDVWLMGLSKKQIVVGAVGAAVAALTIWLLWGVVSVNIMMSIVFVELGVVVSVGFIKVDGMSLLQILLSLFKKKEFKYITHGEDGIYFEEKQEE